MIVTHSAGIVCKAVGSDSREDAPSPPRCSMVLAGSAESRRCGIAVASRALLVSPGQGAASTRRTGEEQRHLTVGFRPQVRAEAYCLRRVEHDGLLRPSQDSGHPVPGLEIDALTCAHHDRARQTGSTLPAPRTALPAPRTALPAPRTALPAPRTEASGRGPEAGLLTALGDLTERCPACLGASSSVECRTAEFSRSFRSSRRRARRRWPVVSAGLSLGGPPSARRATHHRGHSDQDGSTGTGRVPARGPVFLAPDCPARGHRVQGGPPGRRTRSATPTLDPATTHKDSAPTRRTGDRK